MSTIDVQELTAEQVGAVRALAEAVQNHDSIEALSEDTMLTLTRPGLLRLLRTGAHGELVAFAQLNAGSAEMAVHPEHRRRGHGGALLSAILQADPATRIWAHGDLPPARSMAATYGLEQVRDLWVMSRPAPTPAQAPPVQPPAGVQIRTFEVGTDEQAWLEVNSRAFADHPEQGRTTLADLQARIEQPWFDPAGFWLAFDEATGQLLASMWTKVTGPDGATGQGSTAEPAEQAARVGEIYVLGVDPAAQGRGLGSTLTGVAMHAFGQAGLDRLELYVEGENAPAIAVYHRAGFQRSAVHVQYARLSSPGEPGMPR
ncbi:MAG TPA: mycothiol synthase [Beutenbergiaceae bacterium]|nr:mycothiol synthase [Beutenbergiaceae bacterium]